MQFARQERTREWRDSQRHQFDLSTSQFVLDEAGESEASKASERLQLRAGLPLLELNEQVEAFVPSFYDQSIPSRS